MICLDSNYIDYDIFCVLKFAAYIWEETKVNLVVRRKLGHEGAFFSFEV